jgi:hypothetical protein
VVECLPGIHKALGSIPITTKKKKKLNKIFANRLQHHIKKILNDHVEGITGIQS